MRYISVLELLARANEAFHRMCGHLYAHYHRELLKFLEDIGFKVRSKDRRVVEAPFDRKIKHAIVKRTSFEDIKLTIQNNKNYCVFVSTTIQNKLQKNSQDPKKIINRYPELSISHQFSLKTF